MKHWRWQIIHSKTFRAKVHKLCSDVTIWCFILSAASFFWAPPFSAWLFLKAWSWNSPNFSERLCWLCGSLSFSGPGDNIYRILVSYGFVIAHILLTLRSNKTLWSSVVHYRCRSYSGGCHLLWVRHHIIIFRYHHVICRVALRSEISATF